jgi:hypothetical protein
MLAGRQLISQVWREYSWWPYWNIKAGLRVEKNRRH